LAEYGVPRVEPPVEGETASILQRFALTFEKCQLVTHRGCSEMEPEPARLLPGIFGKPVIQYGLVPPRPGHVDHDKDAAMSWLDKRQPESVLYVGFGSEAPVTVPQLHEIALGLELAGTPFLWALKKPNGLQLQADDGDILPPGFEKRTRDRGLVARGWVPQLSILAHSSVGAYLTHGGWGSTIEGVMCGRPMIFLTFLDEHRINAQMYERNKVGFRIPRHKDGSFDRQGIAGAIRAVTCDEQSKSNFVANAKKMQEIVNNRKLQEKYIDDLIQRLRSFEK
jgi:hypothetical protein